MKRRGHNRNKNLRRSKQKRGRNSGHRNSNTPQWRKSTESSRSSVVPNPDFIAALEAQRARHKLQSEKKECQEQKLLLEKTKSKQEMKKKIPLKDSRIQMRTSQTSFTSLIFQRQYSGQSHSIFQAIMKRIQIKEPGHCMGRNTGKPRYYSGIDGSRLREDHLMFPQREATDIASICISTAGIDSIEYVAVGLNNGKVCLYSTNNQQIQNNSLKFIPVRTCLLAQGHILAEVKVKHVHHRGQRNFDRGSIHCNYSIFNPAIHSQHRPVSMNRGPVSAIRWSKKIERFITQTYYLAVAHLGSAHFPGSLQLYDTPNLFDVGKTGYHSAICSTEYKLPRGSIWTFECNPCTERNEFLGGSTYLKHHIIALGCSAQAGSLRILYISYKNQSGQHTFLNVVCLRVLSQIRRDVFALDWCHQGETLVGGFHVYPSKRAGDREREIQILGRMKSGIASIKLMKDNRRLLIACGDGHLGLYNFHAKSKLMEPIVLFEKYHNNHKLLQCSVDEEEHVVSAGNIDGSVRFWSIQTGKILSKTKPIKSLDPHGKPARVNAVSWSKQYNSGSPFPCVWLATDNGVFEASC